MQMPPLSWQGRPEAWWWWRFGWGCGGRGHGIATEPESPCTPPPPKNGAPIGTVIYPLCTIAGSAMLSDKLWVLEASAPSEWRVISQPMGVSHPRHYCLADRTDWRLFVWLIFGVLPPPPRALLTSVSVSQKGTVRWSSEKAQDDSWGEVRENERLELNVEQFCF